MSPGSVSALAVLAAVLAPAAAVATEYASAFPESLASVVRSDAGAGGLYQKVKRLADDSLDDLPRPVQRIATAGKLGTDSAKVESRAALEDMKKIAAFGCACAVTGEPAYRKAAERMILAWARAYEPTGSPIDETKLGPLFVTYGLVRSGLSREGRAETDSWLRLIAERERDAVRRGSVTASNNWNSHRLKIIGLIGCALDEAELVSQAVDGFKTQVQQNLYPDGSSLDFHERDALHYHCYDLEPLLALAIAVHSRGVELYDYQSPSGASLRKSVRFLVPFCEGTKTHAEWLNSKVEFDRVRARAGEAKFEPGLPFEPRDGLRVLELASFFEGDLKPLISKLVKRPGSTYPTWQCVLNEAGRAVQPEPSDRP